MDILNMETPARELNQAWQQLRGSQPGLRIRDGARHLGVSEGELVASGCGDTVVRLQPKWTALLHALERLGTVMALTRNDDAVHERHGVYRKVRVFGNMGLVLDKDIDLRLFLSHWHHAFAVTEEGHAGERCSIQVFDSDGTAVHKVYLTGMSRASVWDEMVKRFRHVDQSPFMSVIPAPAPEPERPDEEIDTQGFRAHWDALQDTHDFHELLKRFGVKRLQGLRLAGEGRAYPVSRKGLPVLLEAARDASLPVMVFVGSPGVVQIHSGPVNNLREVGDWYNVLDPEFNLHVRQSAVESAWVVIKPTVDGPVHSLELFDCQGRLILQVFGVRKPGKAEDLVWRSVLTCLHPLNV